MKAHNIETVILLAICIGTFTFVLVTSHPQHSANAGDQKEAMATQLRFPFRCNCGKVKGLVNMLEDTTPLRLVCYCKDCRGYFNTLNTMAQSENKECSSSTKTDPWGGVDWTHVYPRDIHFTEGKDLLKTSIIRPESKIHQVYTSCCYTPMLRFGGMSVLMNTNLLPEESKSTVRFRIIGRDSLAAPDKPQMSWSVPLSWFWVMPRRIRKDLVEPKPVDIRDVTVLQNFKQG
jgi:Family of unknown function (DUF6151)